MKSFDEFSDAFDYCREVGKPVRVKVINGTYKLYPSGRAEREFINCPDCYAEIEEIIPIDPKNGCCSGCGRNWGRLVVA